MLKGVFVVLGLAASLPLITATHDITLSSNLLVRRSNQARHFSRRDSLRNKDPKIRRATPVLPSGWSFSACIREPSSGRTLTGYSFVSNSMTVDACVAACNYRGYTHAGAEYGQECYCGNDYQGGATGGGTVAPASECAKPCAGDSGQVCGDGNRLSVYTTTTNTFLPSGWLYYNCVYEPSSGRTLTGYSFTSSSMTIPTCISACSSRGFKYAGAEYSQECFCGNSFEGAANGGGATAPATECNMACSGDNKQTCGAGNHLSVYSYQAPVAPPTDWSYFGCVREPAPNTGRTLSGFSFVSASLTIESCISACSSRGYTYAGAEYSQECYCGNSFDGASTGGGTIAPASDCNMPCAGNATETCGAGYRLSVWKSPSGMAPGAPVLPQYWSATSQCITEPTTGRALSGNSFTDQSMTLDKCIDVCDKTGFKYAGAEFGSECYCDNTISTANGGGMVVSSSECNKPCGGNSLQNCGAGYRLTLYTKSPPPNLIPAGWSKNFCTVDQAARVLSGSFAGGQTNLTPASCINICAGQGFSMAGVENGNECWCGNVLNAAFPKRDTECNVPCSGDSTQTCGGGWRLMIYEKDPVAPSGPGAWTIASGGTSGVVMTHVAVMNNETVLVIDRKENNPLLNGLGKPAWGAVWSLVNNTPRALNLVTHSFCSAGSFMSNGTLANFGGHPYTDRNGQAAPDGQQGVRLFNGCPASGTCDVYEDSPRIRLTSNRWYPTSARLHDGSIVILGGQASSGWTNSPELNNPTYEFFPAKNINGHNGIQIFSKFFNETLPHNTYPHVMVLPSKKLFVAANNQAMILDWENDVESRLPNFPNGQRVVYPLNAVGILLPLTPENNYTPEVLICGGSQISDTIDSGALSAQHDYASAQCSRMVLSSAGIAAGWQLEYMPEPRVMGDGVVMPDGKILIINGGRTGTAGYGNLQYRIGESNADHPVFTPLLYNPSAAAGSRFTRVNLPTSGIGRLYHSTATLLPSGVIMIGGSNPNDDVSSRPWPSEYRVEYFRPAYMTATRPTIAVTPSNVNYGTVFTLPVTIPAGAASVTVVLMDLGFVTHSVHMDQRLVKLVSTLSPDKKTLTVTGPPNAPIYPPGPGWIFVVADGIPSVGQRVMVGTGANPPSDPAATANMLASTMNPFTGPHRR